MSFISHIFLSLVLVVQGLFAAPATTSPLYAPPITVSPSSNTATTEDVATSTFYTQSAHINVRSCASMSCPVIETIGPNSSFTYANPTTIADLPTWVETTMSQQDYDGGVDTQYKVGYINKINLGVNPVVISQTASTQSTQQSVSTPTPAVTTVTPPAQETPTYIAPTQAPAPSMDAGIVTNSVPCEEIANEAALNEEALAVEDGVKYNSPQGFAVTDFSVTQAHLQNGACYYEFTYVLGSMYTTAIHYAPNDGDIASCTTGSAGTSCFQDVGTQTFSISEAVFHLIEANLLTN